MPDLDGQPHQQADDRPHESTVPLTTTTFRELGVLEALTALADRGHEAAATARRRRAALVLDTLDLDGAACGTPHAVPTPGLLSGTAGIGHGLLRLAFPGRVPAALLLAPGPGAPRS